MAATRADVARLAGVSPSTVTYVLTGQRSTSERTRDRVRRAVAALDYHPDRNASGLASRSVVTVGFLLRMDRPSIESADLAYVDGVRAGVEPAGMQVVVPMGLRSDPDSGLRELVRSRSVDAAVLMDVAEYDEREGFLLAEGVPTVLIGSSGRRGGAPAVDADFEQMAALAVEHLVSLGHRQILFVSRLADAEVANAYRVQKAAVVKAANDRGVGLVHRSLTDDVAAGAGLVRAEGLTSGCTAVIANNPLALTGVLAGACALGLGVPQSFSVVSIGGRIPSSVLGRPVTEVDVDASLMGYKAGDLLVRLAADPSLRETTLMDARLFDQGSTAPPPRR